MAKWVRCNQTLRDGSPCKQVKTAIAERCDSCARRLAREIAKAEALAADEVVLTLEAEAMEPYGEPAGEPEGKRLSRHQVRAKFGEDVAVDYDHIRAALREEMAKTKSKEIVCPGCGRQNRVEFSDSRARIDAIKLYVGLGLGKDPPAAPETVRPVTDKPMEQMTDEELDELIRAAAA